MGQCLSAQFLIESRTFLLLEREDGICGLFGLELTDRIDMNPRLFILEDRVFVLFVYVSS